MKRPTIEKRSIAMGDGARAAVELMETAFGGRLTHDSGHDEAPTWIFDFDDYGGSQAALRLNKNKLSLYLRATGVDGTAMRPVIERVGAVEEEYPTTRSRPSNSLLRHAPYLSPTSGNRLLRASLARPGLRPVLDAYFGKRSSGVTAADERLAHKDGSELTTPADGRADCADLESPAGVHSDTAEDLAEGMLARAAAAEIDADPTCRDLAETTRRALINARIGQGGYRKRMLGVWGGKCAVTGCEIESVLVASHAMPWADSSNAQRLDEFNGLLLAASVDRLFETELISFDDDGTMLVQRGLDEQELTIVGLTTTSKLRRIDGRHRPYLAAHRQMHGHRPVGVGASEFDIDE